MSNYIPQKIKRQFAHIKSLYIELKRSDGKDYEKFSDLSMSLLQDLIKENSKLKQQNLMLDQELNSIKK